MADYEAKELGWDDEVEKGEGAGTLSSFLLEIMISL